VLIMTRVAPEQKEKSGRKLNKTADTKLEKIMLKDVAKTFKTLSAYFTTTATMSPPAAWTIMTVQTMALYPAKKPLLRIALASFANTVMKAITTEGNPIWMLRNQRLVLAPLRIRSKYTPLKPDVQAAQRTAKSPINLFWVGISAAIVDRVLSCVSDFVSAPSPLPEFCTIATPKVNSIRENQLVLEKLLFSPWDGKNVWGSNLARNS
jgi:hypothetical protein